MKKLGLVLGIIGTVIIFIISCNKLQPDHPQASLDKQHVITFDEKEINAYQDSVVLLLPELEKQQSLIYEHGDYSFYIAKYSRNGDPVLFVEKGNTGEYGEVEKRYYIKNNQLLLYTEKTTTPNISQPVRFTKLYFRNNILFNAIQKKAENEKSLNTGSFAVANPVRKDQFTDISDMEDALKQEGKFDLVFEGITQYPKAKYLVLSRDAFNTYRAVIRVDNEDELIHELSTNPMKYSGIKLDLDWKINKDQEAVYEKGRIIR